MHTIRYTFLAGKLFLVGLLLASTGCESTRQAANQPGQNFAAQNRVSYSWQSFPKSAATPAEAQILIEKEVPLEVKPNTPYTYQLRVSNRTNYAVDSVTLSENLPEGFELIKASPAAKTQDSQLVWELGRLSPGDQVELKVTGKAARSGTLRHTGNTELAMDLRTLETSLAVIQADLDLGVEAPGSVLISETIPVRLQFRNSGTAPVYDARLVHTMPRGLLTADGRSKLELIIGVLQPGEGKSVDLELRGESVGRYETRLVATARNGLTAEATLRTAVQKPELVIEARAPDRRFVGNIIPYDITIRNTGDGVARETQVRQWLPEGTTLASANEGGQAQDNSVVWSIGTLAPGQSKTVSTRVVAKQIMMARTIARAEAQAANSVETALVTDVAGIAAVLLEVTDENDPVPVGEDEVYTVRATNQGSLSATKLLVKCVLEEGMEFVTASGATKATVKDNIVTFDPLPALDPQAEAQWRVVVKARGEGDVRFTASIESDQLDRPVVENEATNFYY